MSQNKRSRNNRPRAAIRPAPRDPAPAPADPRERARAWQFQILLAAVAILTLVVAVISVLLILRPSGQAPAAAPSNPSANTNINTTNNYVGGQVPAKPGTHSSAPAHAKQSMPPSGVGQISVGSGGAPGSTQVGAVPKAMASQAAKAAAALPPKVPSEVSTTLRCQAEKSAASTFDCPYVIGTLLSGTQCVWAIAQVPVNGHFNYFPKQELAMRTGASGSMTLSFATPDTTRFLAIAMVTDAQSCDYLESSYLQDQSNGSGDAERTGLPPATNFKSGWVRITT